MGKEEYSPNWRHYPLDKWHLSHPLELLQGLSSTWLIMFKNSPKNKLHCMQNEKQTKWHIQFM